MLLFATLSVFVGLIAGYGNYHSIDVPIKSYHRGIKVIHAPSHVQKHITHVKIGPGELPVYMTFKSKTSPVYVDQKHKSTKGSYKKTKSYDEPHKLVHEVVKPVYQEIKEIIKPYRKVVQVIEPLKEERLTLVHKGEHKNSYGDDQDNDHKHGYDNHYRQDRNDDYKGERKMKGVLSGLDIDEEYLHR